MLRGKVDASRSYALALVSAMRLRVDEKGMVSPVRYDVDEANEAPAGVAGSDPAQTVWTDSIPPSDIGVSAMGIDEFDHLRVGQRAAPAVRDAVGDELWSNSGRSQEQSDYPAPSRGPSGDIREHCPIGVCCRRPDLTPAPCGTVAERRVYRGWMTARRGTAVASTAVATIVAVVLATSGRADTADPSRQTATPTATPIASRAAARERPRGVVEDCSTTPEWGRRDEFTSRWNLVVGPLALEGAGVMLGYAESVGGNKLFVYVRGGHRVTLELSRRIRKDVGLAFGKRTVWGLRGARRVVTFIACRRGELSDPRFDGWPVTSWVGFLLASSPRCVPLFVWGDDEPSPRRAVIRFGVRSCE